MAYYVIITILLVGWFLFFLTLAQILLSRKKEMMLVRDIKKDLEKIKEDIKIIS